MVVHGEALLAGVPEGLPQSRRALGKNSETSALSGRVLAQTLSSCVTLGKSLGTLRAQFPHLKMRAGGHHSRIYPPLGTPLNQIPGPCPELLRTEHGGVCVSEKLPADLSHCQSWMPLRSPPAMSFQELKVAELMYPDLDVPELSKFYMKNCPSVAEC